MPDGIIVPCLPGMPVPILAKVDRRTKGKVKTMEKNQQPAKETEEPVSTGFMLFLFGLMAVAALAVVYVVLFKK
jgi:hypothetical protein